MKFNYWMVCRSDRTTSAANHEPARDDLAKFMEIAATGVRLVFDAAEPIAGLLGKFRAIENVTLVSRVIGHVEIFDHGRITRFRIRDTVSPDAVPRILQLDIISIITEGLTGDKERSREIARETVDEGYVSACVECGLKIDGEEEENVL